MRILIFIFSWLVAFSALADTNKPVLKMAVTGLNGLEDLQRNFAPFQSKLSELTGLQIEFYPLSSRTIVIEALKSGMVDLVIFGPAEYVVASSKSKIIPVAGLSRPDYYSSIVVLSSSGIRELKDLKGKKLGVGEFGSTAYSLGPIELVKSAGLDPLTDLTTIPLVKQVAWESLKRKDVDALGIKNEQFLIFRDKEKTMTPDQFRVIARGPDLPDDILIAGGHVDPAIAERIRLIIKHNSDALVEAILAGEDNKKYGGMRFLPDIKDQDYDYVRQMFKTVGYPEFSVRYQP